jgi:hypothetical protein
MEWVVEYYDITSDGDRTSRRLDDKDSALVTACDLIRQGKTVHQVVGPNGVKISRGEVERHYSVAAKQSS